MVIPTIESIDRLSLLQLIDYFRRDYEEDIVIKKVKEICLTTQSKEIQRKGMEFLYQHGLFDEMQILINKNKASLDPVDQKWAEVYQLVLDVKNRNYNSVDIFDRINEIEVTEIELKLLLEFTKIRAQFQMNYYQDAVNILYHFDNYIRDVDDLYLKKSFRIRYHRIGIIYTLMQNEIIMTRKHGYKLLTLSRTPCIHVASHIKLGLSYTFESYTQAMLHFQEALKIAEKHQFTSNIELLKNKAIPFVSAYHRKPENITTNNRGERAHLEIAKGNIDKAIEILEERPLETPFEMYYLGKAKQDRSLLMQSYREFIHNRNDHFFSRLPLDELKRVFFD